MRARACVYGIPFAALPKTLKVLKTLTRSLAVVYFYLFINLLLLLFIYILLYRFIIKTYAHLRNGGGLGGTQLLFLISPNYIYVREYLYLASPGNIQKYIRINPEWLCIYRIRACVKRALIIYQNKKKINYGHNNIHNIICSKRLTITRWFIYSFIIF
jgi:hypothetical protein